MNKIGKATYKWSDPCEWLVQFLEGISNPQELRTMVIEAYRHGGFDEIQDEFQSDMASEGYFNTIQTCEWCGNGFDTNEDMFSAVDGDIKYEPVHGSCAEEIEVEPGNVIDEDD